MSRRVLTWSVLLAVSALLIFGIRGSNADGSGNTSRFKTVVIQTTQYIWELVSNRDGRVICQVIVNHPNRPSNEEAIQICGDQIFPPLPTPVPVGTPNGTPEPRPTQIPFNLADFFANVYWRFISTQELTRTVKVPLPEMIVNITVPPNQKAPFYAIIAAYEPVFGEHITSINGTLNGVRFTCPSARCQVPIKSDTALELWATSSFGDDSRHMQAVLIIDQVYDQNQNLITSKLRLASLTPAIIFQDACASIWGANQFNPPAWANFPATPDDLNTKKPYQYLAGKLIASGIASASDCPAGGLTAVGGPNTCGLEKANQAVVDWQNMYDVDIWDAGHSLGIPPRLIKTVIGQESQFWPGNSRYSYGEYGLAQISQSGADVALRWDNDLFLSVCNGLIFDCGKIYGRLPTWLQGTMRGGLIRTIDAECATCPHGIDLARTFDTIPTITRTLRSNCYQTNYLTKRYAAKPSYEDLWRFTLVSYHSGYECLREALADVQINQQPADWKHVSAYLTCPGSILYIEDLWKSLQQYNQYLLKPEEANRPVSLATFVVPPGPTRPAPTSTPAPVPSLAHIRVQVYVDSNKDNYPEDSERAEGVKVTATLSDGTVLRGTTANGEVIFDLSGRPVDSEVTVALPDLYRSEKVRVTRDGEIPVIFRLEQPVVPPALP